MIWCESALPDELTQYLMNCCVMTTFIGEFYRPNSTIFLLVSFLVLLAIIIILTVDVDSFNSINYVCGTTANPHTCEEESLREALPMLKFRKSYCNCIFFQGASFYQIFLGWE